MGGGVCGTTFWYHVAALVIPFNLIYSMTISVKLNLYLLTPPKGRGGGLGQNICYHVAVRVILFYLICNITIF